MSKFIIFLLIFISYPSLAKDCEISGYKVMFFNGVATTNREGKDGLTSIELAISKYSYNGESIEYDIMYNDSRVADGTVYVLDDFAETFAQRYEELNGQALDSWEIVWETLHSGHEGSLMQSLYDIVTNGRAAVIEMSNALNNLVIASLADLATDLVGSTPNTEQVKTKARLMNDTMTWQGKKLIFVAHSQGNLWANFAYNNVLTHKGYDESNVKVIHIAPASTTLNGNYILSNEDMVIKGLQLLTLDLNILPNAILPVREGYLLGHSLSDVYLYHDLSKSMFVTYINNAFSSLTKPSMEEFLFKMEFNYTRPMDASYYSPSYGFIDSRNNSNYFDISDDSSSYDPFFVSYLIEEKYLNIHLESNIYSLKKRSILTFVEESEERGNTIKIDQCDDLPDEGSFLFANYRNNINLWNLGNTSQVTNVYDRYGDKLESKTFNLNLIDSPFLKCMNFGTLFDLKATQDHYSDEEKELLEKYGLSGNYHLEAPYLATYCQGH